MLSALLILFQLLGIQMNLVGQQQGVWQSLLTKPDSTFRIAPLAPDSDERDSQMFVAVYNQPFGHGTHATEKRRIKDSLNLLKQALYHLAPQHKNDPDSFRITENFTVNPSQNVTPMDNGLAVSPLGYIVSVVNANYTVQNSSGQRLMLRNFKQLANDPSLTSSFFDPRVYYDVQRDRFYMIILHGRTSADSRLLLFVSKEANPLQGWHVYSFRGDPYQRGLMADFPQLGVSANHLAISLNQFHQSEGGFDGSLLYVLEKDALLTGSTVSSMLYDDLKVTEKKEAFNMVPANAYDGYIGSNLYFISSKDRGGDGFYLMKLDPTKGIIDRAEVSAGAYSLPPDAIQKQSNSMLDGGDCRISGAFLRNGLIHFCLSTEGKSLRNAIYYGRVDPEQLVCEARTIQTTKDMAYAVPVSFAANNANRAVVLALVFSSEIDYPSIGYLYVDDQMKDYPLVTVYEGLSEMDLIPNELDRWGDYCAGVFVPGGANPTIWFSAAGVGANERWENRVFKLEGDLDTINRNFAVDHFEAFPNPVFQSLKIRLELQTSMQIDIALYSTAGQRIETVWNGGMTKGNNFILFEPRAKASGMYILRIQSGKSILYTEKLFIE